ncbi:hypothetical protein BV20DRAFT_976404 [Pilatotrama ljubarskyi]|nr:hypothetical protein BV20DRAFT_976404 [Pilatotrama ljubarskyi]
MTTLRTNVAGPVLISATYLPLLAESNKRTIVNISSTAGSISHASSIGTRNTTYAISKAALNMLTAKQKAERPDITAVSICPAWVKTDMGSSDAMLEPKDSVASI